MDKGASSWDDATIENLLVVDDNSRILSCRVSKIYGKALLGAMALPKSSSPVTDLHVSFLPDHEPWTMNTIKIAARTVAPGDNFMFVDDSRKIVSCRINPDYGVTLLENILQEVSQTHSVLFQPTVTQARATNNQAMVLEASQHASEELHQSDLKASSSPPPSIARTHAYNLETLSDEILSSANGQPYDRDWMNKYGISEECLKGSRSKHRLQMMVRHGAIKVGDKLCVTYYPGRGPVVKVGKVLQSLKKGRLDLRIASTRREPDSILYDCKGPRDIISGMDTEFQMKHHARPLEAWKVVNVVSDDGQELGSLWEVRQAYQVFAEQMAEWGARSKRP